ncbi:MAG TPA: NAD(P)(+) transhydrogenase (Re/Si-specific) subunit beta [Flavobacteriales bacterium]|nr:NAD(P)(+) transhydrogenase (Re/Si-specific) subunit beta [Flavobacteriales bacterium]
MGILYLLSTIGLVQGLKFMGDPARARLGNTVAAFSVVLALGAVVWSSMVPGTGTVHLVLLGLLLAAGTVLGGVWSYRVAMTAMPQLVSLFNALGGLSAVLLGLNMVHGQGVDDSAKGASSVLMLGVLFGGLAFTGSIVAYLKLDGRKLPKAGQLHRTVARVLLVVQVALFLAHLLLPQPIAPFGTLLSTMALLALLYGLFLTLPIGGADMPVLIALLNALTGVATLLAGLLFKDPVMLIGGILVGATGLLLTMQMSKAMNRTLRSVLAGSIKGARGAGAEAEEQVRPISAVETASLLAFGKHIAIVPGYGMAVSQAQQAVYEMQGLLQRLGAGVHYIIHPVAGRMPGHMNVLLAEANVPYASIHAMEEVNDHMDRYDVVLVIGANDVVNPAAESDPASSIHGMPIIRAYKAKQVVVLKRGMAKGYSGERNLLFERQNCRVLFGDAKNSLQAVIDELKRI